MIDDAADTDHPRFSSSLFGHEGAERLFLEAVNQNRIHHGWLITGPRGIGKATFAWRIAKFLLANNPGVEKSGGAGLFGEELPPIEYETLSLDEDDPIARRIEAGGHGGLSVIERSVNDSTGKLRSDIVINDIRKLSGFFSQTASEGGWRVAIIDAADEMNVSAANALLKILEEPPEKSILLLIAHSPGRLLPTIKSRCRQLALKPLSDDSVRAVLAARFPEIGNDDLNAAAVMAAGAPGKAIELVGRAGIDLYRELASLLVALPSVDMPRVHTLATKLGAAKADGEYRLFSEMLQSWLQRLIRQQVSGEASADIMAGESDQISRISALARVDQWLDLWEKVGHLTARADAVNLDRKQVIVSVFSSLQATVRA